MPLYCETPALIAGFPAEPINTWSNLIIIALGVIAFIIITRAPLRGARVGVYVLALLLTATGIGSLLWHGFRTSAFLILDVLPGALFLLTFTYLWLRRFYGRMISILSLLAFILLEALSLMFGEQFIPRNLFYVPAVPAILLFGLWLIARTYQESPRVAFMGTGTILLALFALMFRSIDLAVCPSFPIGTHFLWHGILSLGALLGILTLLVLDYSRKRLAVSNLRMDVM